MLDRFERFVSVISGISRNLHRITTEEMEKYGLKGSYAVYLVAMQKHSEGITAARLSEICEKNKAAVSRAVAELEQMNLIRKEGTHYRTRLLLTEKGKTAAEFVCDRASLAVDRAGSGLTEEQRALFYRSIDIIAKNLQSMGTNGLATEKQQRKEF